MFVCNWFQAVFALFLSGRELALVAYKLSLAEALFTTGKASA